MKLVLMITIVSTYDIHFTGLILTYKASLFDKMWVTLPQKIIKK